MGKQTQWEESEVMSLRGRCSCKLHVRSEGVLLPVLLALIGQGKAVILGVGGVSLPVL